MPQNVTIKVPPATDYPHTNIALSLLPPEEATYQVGEERIDSRDFHSITPTTIKQDIRNKIMILTDDRHRRALMEPFNNNDMSFVLRRACAGNDACYEIIDLLCSNINELAFEINKKGISGQTALDIAIKFNNLHAIVRLLKVESLEVPDITKEQLITKYGQELRRNHFLPDFTKYVKRMNDLNKEVTESAIQFRNDFKKFEILNEKMQIFVHKLILSDPDEEQHLLENTLGHIDEMIALLKINIAQWDSLRQCFNSIRQILFPSICAQKHLLFGNEVTRTGQNLLTACCENEKRMNDLQQVIDENIEFIIQKLIHSASGSNLIKLYLDKTQLPTKAGSAPDTSTEFDGLHSKSIYHERLNKLIALKNRLLQLQQNGEVNVHGIAQALERYQPDLPLVTKQKNSSDRSSFANTHLSFHSSSIERAYDPRDAEFTAIPR